MSSALLCNGSHVVDPPRRSHSLETRYDKEGMLSLHFSLNKGPHSTPKQYHAPAPMLGALLCNGSHAMDPPRRSHSLETRLDRGHAQLPLPTIYTLRTTDDMRRTGRTGAGGRADGRTGGRRISEGKTPNLTRHLTWPWEIQRGRPRITVKLSDLPPPSR